MKKFLISLGLLLGFALGATELPEALQKIMQQPKYAHAQWGVYVKDLQTGKVLFDLNSHLLFSPASTTKLFSIAALLHTYGADYRFKTPVYAIGELKNGVLEGNLVLVAQGDLTFGGRQSNADEISFTKMDHIIANEVPGVILTKEDPLKAIRELAKLVYQSGLREVKGDVVIDDSLFETTEKRGMVLSPIMLNENLIDILINPSEVGQKAEVTWRPKVAGYTIQNQVQTVAQGDLALEITTVDNQIIVKGSIPLDQHDIIRTFAVQDPKAFARTAFIESLQNQGIKISKSKSEATQPRQQLAVWSSPPLSEYAKLILKVSHNLGADLVPLLLASHKGQKTFNEGMRLLGNFAIDQVKLSRDEFVFIDAAGGNENRLTPQAEVELLAFMQQKPYFLKALPNLGVDGSLEDFAKNTPAVGKVWAKTGTGVAFNLATGRYFLITQALAGYIQGKNNHLWAYMVVVNNAQMPTLDEILPIFEDLSQLSSHIYDFSQ